MNACGSQKQRFVSKADASEKAREIARCGKRRHRPYFCEPCGAWHLTTMNKRQQKAKGWR